MAVNVRHGICEEVEEAVQKELASLVAVDGKSMRSRACCFCDRLLVRKNAELLPLEVLKKRKWAVHKFERNHPVREYYVCDKKFRDEHSWLSSYMLSPRSSICSVVRNVSNVKYMIEVCHLCNTSNTRTPPDLSIYNFPLCGAPELIVKLNDVERALIGKGRPDERHIFSLFGGQHKTIRSWQQIFRHSTEHLSSAMRYSDSLGIPEKVTCTLSGPFTKEQKVLALQRTTICRRKVKVALMWLAANNNLYDGEGDRKFVAPIVIDHSEEVPVENSRVESVFESTIIYPEVNKVDETSAGHKNQAEYLASMLEHKTTDYLMVSRPTRDSIKNFDINTIASCLPLQFPYGTKFFVRDVKANEISDFLVYLSELAIPAFQRGEFLFLAYTIHAKSVAVHQGSIKSNYKLSEDMRIRDYLNTISIEDINHLIESMKENRNDFDVKTRKVLRAISAVNRIVICHLQMRQQSRNERECLRCVLV